MSKITNAESLVDAFAEGNYEQLKQLDEFVDHKINNLLEAGAYQQFFKQKLAGAGKPVAQMSPDEKKRFFAGVKADWAKQKK